MKFTNIYEMIDYVVNIVLIIGFVVGALMFSSSNTIISVLGLTLDVIDTIAIFGFYAVVDLFSAKE